VTDDCFLGVRRSLSGKRWKARAIDDRTALALSQGLGIPEIVGRVLAARGIGFESAPDFLNPTLMASLPDPSHLKGMDEAVERLASAVMQGETIALFGDYDVDGATSSALLTRFLEAVGQRPRVYIPDRLREGYGPNGPALRRLREEGASVVVTLDCGTAAHEALKVAEDAGLEVVVVDHHVAEPLLPRAVAVINPNRLDETSPHRQLAAVGVAFLLVVGLNRALRQAGWYGAARREPDLREWLDLVALGTICDVVPLTGVNRALVAQGLKVMGQRRNPGIKALADVARLTEAPGTYHAGFLLGPRVNAGGRVGESDLGVRLLTTADEDEARTLARHLDDLNRQRQEIEARVLDEAMRQAERKGGGNRPPLILVAGEGWHPGVIGIVASRIKEEFNRPTCVVALDGETGSGSGRSVSGVDLGAAVIAARQAGLLTAGGGHAMAAGFKLAREKLDSLESFLIERIAAGLADVSFEPLLHLDGALKVGGCNLDLARALDRVAPFGVGNAEPRFVLTGARLAKADFVGKDGGHLRCILTGEGGGRLKAIAFNCLETPLGQALRRHDGAAFHLAGRIRLDTWGGDLSAQFMLDDAAPAT
jgi:single-stranded-DNA-specific exonuclease